LVISADATHKELFSADKPSDFNEDSRTLMDDLQMTKETVNTHFKFN